jgi:hypothetical protein
VGSAATQANAGTSGKQAARTAATTTPPSSAQPPTTPAPSTSAAPTSDAPPTAKPDGTYTSSCDYVLGNFTDNTRAGFRFIADAQMHNTGNIGTVNVIKAAWFQGGGKALTQSKTVKVPAGHSMRSGITLEGTQDQIDLIQTLSGKNCKVTVTIVNTYGAAR